MRHENKKQSQYAVNRSIGGLFAAYRPFSYQRLFLFKVFLIVFCRTKLFLTMAKIAYNFLWGSLHCHFLQLFRFFAKNRVL